MADISKLSRLVAGVQRHVDLSQNTLVVGSIKIGTASPTELTKALLDGLLAISSDLASNANAKGASLVGIEDAAAQFTSTNVEGALAESLDAAQAAQADATQALSDAAAAQADATQALSDAAAAQSDIDNHLSDSADAHDASAISSVPAGNLAATDVQAALNELDSEKIASSEKGANNGVATLDAGGKIPAAQLPNSVMDFKGNWDASTNSPSLADGTGSAGDVYRTNVAGSQDLGSGSQTFAVGDWVVYNGSIWEKSNNSNAVMSVNSQTGVVVLDTDDVSDSGATNKYFTAAAAKAAAVADAIADGVTDVAPSQNAVFDALAGKANTSHTHVAADITDFTSAAKAAAVADSITDGVTDVAPSQNAVFDALAALSSDAVKESLNAGEAMAANTLFAVRLAKAADAGFVAGRVYKADKDASANDNFHALGLCRPSALLAAGDAVMVVKHGKLAAASHGFTVGLPIYLSASGALTQTAPSAADEAVVKLGMARDANTIEVQIQIMGIN
jgi:hypothetical protein